VDLPELPSTLGPVAFLLGHWRGEAHSLWPDEELHFVDDTVFDFVGKPWIAYRQQTWLVDVRPSHAESGYLSVKEDGAATLTIAQPSGIVEVSTGTADAGRIELSSIHLGRAPDAKPVTAIARSLHLEDGDVLRYLLRVSLNGEPLADHISGELHRVG